MSLVKASLERNEEKVQEKLRDKRQKQKPKLKVGDLVRTADKNLLNSIKVIQLIGRTNYTQLQKLLIISFLVIN